MSLLGWAAFNYAHVRSFFKIHWLRRICRISDISGFDFPTHSCFSDSVLSLMFIIILLNVQKSDPWSGFVKKSATISSVGQYTTVALPCLMLSVTKKYFILMCLVFFPNNRLPLFSRSIALWLSWKITLSVTKYPCAWIKFQTHRIMPRASFTPTNSDSVEL